MNKAEALNILSQIKRSVENDVGSAINFYNDHNLNNEEKIGFFAIPRMIFPEVEGLAAFYAGRITSTSENGVNFIREYFSKVNEEYRTKGAFIYIIYRHGLTHQHFPKSMSYNGQAYGWAISLGGLENVTKHSHLQIVGGNVQIDGQQLYKDFIKALSFYEEDIQNDKPGLLDNFITAYDLMVESKEYSEYLKPINPAYYLSQSDFNFLNI